MYEDILRFWMDKEFESPLKPDTTQVGARPSDQVLRHLKTYGPAHPHLYLLVLRFLTSSPALLTRHTTDIMGILEYVDKEKIIPPLGIVQVLSRNDVASVGLVKEWLMRRISESRDEIAAVSGCASRECSPSFDILRYNRTKRLSTLTGPRQRRNCKRLRNYLTLITLVFFMSLVAQPVVVRLTFQRYISCASIAIISGELPVPSVRPYWAQYLLL